MNVRLAAAAIIGLVAGVSPPAMAAPVIVPDRACFREGGPASFTASGFQPGQPVAISLDGRSLDDTPTTDSSGSLRGAIAPLSELPQPEQTRSITITQTTNLALTATRTITQTQLDVDVKPTAVIRRRGSEVSFKHYRPFKIRARGFYGARTLYVHVRGRAKRNRRIAKPRGACGRVALTRRLLFKRSDRAGNYIMQFDTSRRYTGLRKPLTSRACGVDAIGGAPFCLKGLRIRRIFRFSRNSPFAAPVFGAAPRWVRGA